MMKGTPEGTLAVVAAMVLLVIGVLGACMYLLRYQ